MAKVVDIFTGKPKRKTQVRRRQERAYRRRVIDELVEACQQFGDPDLELFMKINEDAADDALAMSDVLAIYLVRKKLADYQGD